MTFQPQHFGLYFTREHVQVARKNREREPFKSAWAMLESGEQTDPFAAVQWLALRYRCNDDTEAGAEAVGWLREMGGFGDDTPYFDLLVGTLTLAHTFEMLRDHPTFAPKDQSRWLNQFAEWVTHLNSPAHDIGYVEHLWLGALNVVAGIVLEREDIFQTGVETYQAAVRDDLHPSGHIPKAVESGDGQGFYRQLLAVKGLVLMAEAAAHVGVDLWQYNARGVSVMTAAAYLMYYYYYPEKWQWDGDAGLEEKVVKALFREHGGFLEMVNRHDPPQAIKLLLDDLRPIYDPSGGGLTTLTHGIAKRRGLFG